MQPHNRMFSAARFRGVSQIRTFNQAAAIFSDLLLQKCSYLVPRGQSHFLNLCPSPVTDPLMAGEKG